LFNHGFDFTTRHSFGEIQWGRGNCWYTAGVVEYLDLLDDSYLGVKMFLIDTLRAQVEALRKYQHPGGMWHTLIRYPDSYLEASATAGFAYGILKAVRRGYLPGEFQDCGMRALQAIVERIGEDGTVSDVSYGTAISADLDAYRRVPLCPMTYGQALTLLVLAEALHSAGDQDRGGMV
jgi:unsaturated rhamnogalacturonyl hydrolase